MDGFDTASLTHLIFCFCHLQGNRLLGSIPLWDKVTRTWPKVVYFLQNLSITFFELKDFSKGIGLLNKILAIHPRCPRALHMLIEACAITHDPGFQEARQRW